MALTPSERIRLISEIGRRLGAASWTLIDLTLRQFNLPSTDESFNGKFRDEYLSLQWFRNRVDAKVGIEQWRRHYNDVRPHSSLGYLTPAEFKAQLRAGSDDGGRSPAMPAHADQEEHESDLTMPTGAVLQ